MKHCEEYAALLSAFADGEVTETEREEVLRHLDGCGGCRAYLADLLAMQDELSVPVPELPENFAARVMWRVRCEKSKMPRKNRRILTAVASAVACLVLVMALPSVLGSVGALDDAAQESAVLEDSMTDDMAADDAVLDETAESVMDGGTNGIVNDCETPSAAGKTESNALAVSREQMDQWLAENETETFRAEETEEETVYYLDSRQYESFRAFMQEQGVFMGEISENEVVAVYVR